MSANDSISGGAGPNRIALIIAGRTSHTSNCAEVSKIQPRVIASVADANTENPSVKVSFVLKALTIAIEINNAVAITTIHPVARFCVMYTDAQTAKYAVSNRADFKDNVGMLFEPGCR